MGYSVDIDVVLNLSLACVQACERYEEIRSLIRNADPAAASLAGSDGSATEADSSVLALIEEFNEYLKTSAARYDLVSDNLYQAADAYTQADDDQRDVFEDFSADLEGYEELASYEPDMDVAAEAEATERPEGANTDLPGGNETTHWATDERSN